MGQITIQFMCQSAKKALAKGGVGGNIMIDCSHANSSKNPEIRPQVLSDITHQILRGNNSIIGVMVESFINSGNQPIPENLENLKYGISSYRRVYGLVYNREINSRNV